MNLPALSHNSSSLSPQLARCSPESQGVSSQAILNFVQAVEADLRDVHSFMLLRHGAVVAEGWWSPYGPQRPHMLFSLSKSFTSSAIGLAVSEGLLSVDDRVLSFFEDYAPARVGKNLAAMRVRDLLTMTTGHAKDTTGALFGREHEPWAKIFLSLPVKYQPGTHFLYNTGATYMLSAIVQRLTGQTLLEYLRPRLFEPLGIENPTWESDPQGIHLGGTGLAIRTVDIAHFGQMLLQKGRFGERQVLPEAWVAEATAGQVPNGDAPDSDWTQGYGYQFWRSRHNAYRGDGAFGQYCLVMPEQDAVLAVTSGMPEMQGLLNLAWQHLLPAMAPAPLPEDGAKLAGLRQKLASLAISPPQGQPAGRVGRYSGATAHLQPNQAGLEQIRFTLAGDQVQVWVQGERGEEALTCGLGHWHESDSRFLWRDTTCMAASACWSSPNTLVITQRMVDTPFYQTLTCRFGRARVTIDGQVNVAFGPTRLPKLVGLYPAP